MKISADEGAALEAYFGPNPGNHGSYHWNWSTADEIYWKENYRLWMAAVREGFLADLILITAMTLLFQLLRSYEQEGFRSGGAGRGHSGETKRFRPLFPGGQTIRTAFGRTRNSTRSRFPRNSPLYWMGRSFPLKTARLALKCRSFLW